MFGRPKRNTLSVERDPCQIHRQGEMTFHMNSKNGSFCTACRFLWLTIETIAEVHHGRIHASTREQNPHQCLTELHVEDVFVRCPGEIAAERTQWVEDWYWSVDDPTWSDDQDVGFSCVEDRRWNVGTVTTIS